MVLQADDVVRHLVRARASQPAARDRDIFTISAPLAAGTSRRLPTQLGQLHQPDQLERVRRLVQMLSTNPRWI